MFTACGGNSDTVAEINEPELSPQQTISATEEPELSELSVEEIEGIHHQFDSFGFSLMLPSSWDGRYDFRENSMYVGSSDSIFHFDGYGAGNWSFLELWLDDIMLVGFYGRSLGENVNVTPIQEWLGDEYNVLILAQSDEYTNFAVIDLYNAERALGAVEFNNDLEFLISNFNQHIATEE